MNKLGETQQAAALDASCGEYMAAKNALYYAAEVYRAAS